jgi:hypothetical protein
MLDGLGKTFAGVSTHFNKSLFETTVVGARLCISMIRAQGMGE